MAPSDHAAQRPPAEPPYHPDGLTDDVLGHLARSLRPVDENDGNLRDPEVLSHRPESHFDLKGVAVRAHVIEVDGLQHGPAKALEPTRRIPHVQAGYCP